MGPQNCVLTLLLIGTILVINADKAIRVNETETNTFKSTNITLDTNKGPVGCHCTKNESLNGDEIGNCKTKSWAFKYGKKWCYVDLPSNCTDLKNSTSDPKKKYSAQACSKKGPGIINKICKL